MQPRCRGIRGGVLGWVPLGGDPGRIGSPMVVNLEACGRFKPQANEMLQPVSDSDSPRWRQAITKELEREEREGRRERNMKK